MPVPAFSTAHQLALSPSHTAIASPCLGNATSRIAVSTAVVIAITTMATTTKVPCSETHFSGQAKGSRGLGILNGGMRKGLGDDRHWHFGMRWDGRTYLLLYSYSTD
jgi:hypothetical protein